jgi:hypothetical protein
VHTLRKWNMREGNIGLTINATEKEQCTGSPAVMQQRPVGHHDGQRRHSGLRVTTLDVYCSVSFSFWK